MINHLFVISLLLLIKMKNTKEICVEDHLKLCYLNDLQNNSILVWFTTEKNLNDTFSSYRFVLRSINHLSLSNTAMEILTNFTDLIDFNNSLRMFNLNLGEYKVCTEFQSDSTTFIYQPIDGCIYIQIGISSHTSLKQNPAPLLITLAISIVLFFILGLVVQWAKEKRRKTDEDKRKRQVQSPNSITITSVIEQPDSVVRKLFYHHIDQPQASRMRQWARNRAFRHRISRPEQEFDRLQLFKKWSKHFLTQPDHNHQIPLQQTQHDHILPRKTSFHLSIPEAYRMT